MDVPPSYSPVGGGGDGREKEKEVLREFLTLLAVCHTVIRRLKMARRLSG